MVTYGQDDIPDTPPLSPRRSSEKKVVYPKWTEGLFKHDSSTPDQK